MIKLFVRLIFLSLFMLVSFVCKSEDYNYMFEAVGDSITKVMKLDNGTSHILYENKYGWTDDLGNYGTGFCYGKIESKNKVATDFNLNM